MGFGDYSALYRSKTGTEHKSPIFFERKSLPDLFGTLTDENRHKRLRDRCKEANEVGAKIILAIEGTDQEVWEGVKNSQVKGATILKILDTMWLKYDLIPMFCSSRQLMAWRMVNMWNTFRDNYETGQASSHS